MIYGIGINDADYSVTAYEETKQVWVCPFYACWKSMMYRCYHKSGSYYGKVKVCKEWHRFSVFKSWMQSKDWIGRQLDKDIFGSGLEYNPESCAFVSQQLNTFIAKMKVGDKLKSGAYFVKARSKNKWMSTSACFGKRVTVGYCATQGEAVVMFWKYRLSLCDKFKSDHPEAVKRVKKIIIAEILKCADFYGIGAA